MGGRPRLTSEERERREKEREEQRLSKPQGRKRGRPINEQKQRKRVEKEEIKLKEYMSALHKDEIKAFRWTGEAIDV